MTMEAWRMTRRTLTAAVLVTLVALLAGCAGGIGSATLSPRLSPPVIARPGVLRAAIDLSYPPFGGTVKGQQVGLDVDVAAAIADRLGLTLEIVNAKPDAAAALAKSGKVDIVLGALTVEQAVSLQLAYAGTYLTDSSAVFASNVASLAVGDLSSKRIAVQNGSTSYWLMADAYGEESLVVMPTLLEAMRAVGAGKADVVAGDALVAAYIGRGIPALKYGGQLAPAFPVGVGVTQDKAKLETEVRATLDKLSSEGVLETLRRKWAGDLPRFTVPASPDTQAATTTPEATVTQ
jgi:polar amino acid transport system substrate-binding protein